MNVREWQQTMIKFNDFLVKKFYEIKDLDDDEFEDKIKDSEWAFYFRKMREGKPMLEIIKEIRASDLLIDLKKYEEEQSNG